MSILGENRLLIDKYLEIMIRSRSRPCLYPRRGHREHIVNLDDEKPQGNPQTIAKLADAIALTGNCGEALEDHSPRLCQLNPRSFACFLQRNPCAR